MMKSAKLLYLLALSCFYVLLNVNAAFAMDDNGLNDKKFVMLQGTWYNVDSSKNDTITLKDGFIGDEKITEFKRTSGLGNSFGFQISHTAPQGSDAYDISRFTVYGLSANSEAYHQYLHDSNSQETYRKTSAPLYHESIGGIYLGMAERDLLNMYGTPDNIEDGLYTYSKLGMEVVVLDKSVMSIKIYASGDRVLDRSGFGPNNSAAEFKELFQGNEIFEMSSGSYILYNKYNEVMILQTNEPKSLKLYLQPIA